MGIAMLTKGDRDKTNTRAHLQDYMASHGKPTRWFPIILRLLDALNDLHFALMAGKDVLELEN